MNKIHPKMERGSLKKKKKLTKVKWVAHEIMFQSSQISNRVVTFHIEYPEHLYTSFFLN